MGWICSLSGKQGMIHNLKWETCRRAVIWKTWERDECNIRVDDTEIGCEGWK